MAVTVTPSAKNRRQTTAGPIDFKGPRDRVESAKAGKPTRHFSPPSNSGSDTRLTVCRPWYHHTSWRDIVGCSIHHTSCCCSRGCMARVVFVRSCSAPKVLWYMGLKKRERNSDRDIRQLPKFDLEPDRTPSAHTSLVRNMHL